ncbi:cysteine hydrolase family protein [Yinghuangia sp. YIM S09857]|uniref:cysteine hydrolase family protein n=1 Tax=Yinghuangia sp. YIM S09857 TaxID=3436929 RepID=UPI003F52B138
MTAAVLVVDMQNGFCRPTGSVARYVGMLPNMDAVVAEQVALLDSARAAGLPVVYTRHTWRADLLDLPPKLREPFPEGVSPMAPSSWDVQVLDELTPADHDPVIDKNRFDAFLYTDLEVVLRALGVRQLLVAGVMTNFCVESTVRTASQLDYDVHVAEDCTSAPPDRHGPALEAMGALFATVGPWKTGLAALTGTA